MLELFDKIIAFFTKAKGDFEDLTESTQEKISAYRNKECRKAFLFGVAVTAVVAGVIVAVI